MGVRVRAPIGTTPFQIDIARGIKRSVKSVRNPKNELEKKKIEGSIHFFPGKIVSLTDEEWNFIKEKHHNLAPDFLVISEFEEEVEEEENPKPETREAKKEVVKAQSPKRKKPKELVSKSETGLAIKEEKGISTT
jgi:hypothetical protein